MDDIKNIIESLLFVAETPLTIDRIKSVVSVSDAREIREALTRLSEEYEARKGGFFLREVAGGYQIRTRPEYTEWIKRLIQPNPPRVSKAALETLAIVAYKQPVLRSDIENIRRVDCGGILRVLLERKLIRILGRKEIPGRPLIYGTTKQFLEIFDLKDLKDLPTPKEIEAMTAASSRKEDHAVPVDAGEETGGDGADRAVAVDPGEETEGDGADRAVAVDPGEETEVDGADRAVAVDPGEETEGGNGKNT